MRAMIFIYVLGASDCGVSESVLIYWCILMLLYKYWGLDFRSHKFLVDFCSCSTIGAIVMTPLLTKLLAGQLVPVDAAVSWFMLYNFVMYCPWIGTIWKWWSWRNCCSEFRNLINILLYSKTPYKIIILCYACEFKVPILEFSILKPDLLNRGLIFGVL